MKTKHTAYVIDTKGNRWKWNCGWYIVDKFGQPLKTRAKRLVSRQITNRDKIILDPNGVSPAYVPDKLDLLFSTEWLDSVAQGSKQRPDIRQQPMSHIEFRKNVKLLDVSDKKQREVLHGMDKPGRHWRRFVQRESWVHELFGACYLLASDGCHAIIETVHGDHEKVCFENLSENTGIKLPPRFATDKKPSTKRREKQQAEVSALIGKYLAKINA